MSAKAWFVICVPPEKPDGPGEIFGPFNTREGADADAATGDCGNRHLISWGAGSERARLSVSQPALDAYWWYRDEHPECIPESCEHIFPTIFPDALASSPTRCSQ